MKVTLVVFSHSERELMGQRWIGEVQADGIQCRWQDVEKTMRYPKHDIDCRTVGKRASKLFYRDSGYQ